jgi:preprotein translocase SecF subunit
MIDFLKHRYLFLLLSLIFIVGGITYGLITGYKFDIDFKGGTNIQVDLKENFDNNEVSKIVQDITGVAPLIQKMSGGDSTVMITTDVITNGTVDNIVAALKARYTNMDTPSTKNIQPSYGKELVNSAILAVCVAIILILLYVGIRFKTLGFNAAITAIIALLHDALALIAIYGIIKFPINATFVAVILTIVGYSINDTIIVYDRIRENRRKITRSKDLKETINLSVNQTLRRTLYTSLTTIMAITVVYIFASIHNQQVLEEFSLPLVLGILFGTYSSIFIASSLWYIFEDIGTKMKKDKKA